MADQGLTDEEIARLQALLVQNQRVGAKRQCEDERDPTESAGR